MHRATTRSLFGGAAIALAVVACSDSDSGSDSDSNSDSSSDADSAAQFFLDFADVAGVELDQSCVEAAVKTLSPEDTRTLADAPAASLELISSAPFNGAIDAVGEQIFDDCVTRELDQ